MLEFTRIAYSMEVHGYGEYKKWRAVLLGKWFLYVHTDRGWEIYAETDEIAVALGYLITDPVAMDASTYHAKNITVDKPPDAPELSVIEEAALVILEGDPSLRDALTDVFEKGG